MIDTDTPIQAPAADRRPGERRRFLQLAGSATVALSLAACGGSDDGGTPTPTPTPTGTATPTPTPTSTVALDVDYLNFALQIQYLSAQYFIRATTGAGVEALPASADLPGGGAELLKGTGTQGAATGGAAVTFADPLLGQYVREIAAGELAHLLFLRSSTGAAATAQPAIDLSSSVSGGFTRLARAGGYIGPSDTFDPFSSELNFLLGAFLIQDVLVSGYIGVTPSIANPLYINASADILAAKSFHAAMIRSQLYARGAAARTATDQFSNARDALDGATDIDQGVTGNASTSNVVPTNVDGGVFGRTPAQVLNVLYTTSSAVTGGGFFPSGVISTYFRTSGAN